MSPTLQAVQNFLATALTPQRPAISGAGINNNTPQRPAVSSAGNTETPANPSGGDFPPNQGSPSSGGGNPDDDPDPPSGGGDGESPPSGGGNLYYGVPQGVVPIPNVGGSLTSTIVWVGGKPNATYSGHFTPQHSQFHIMNVRQPIDISSELKNYSKRVTPASNLKLSRDCSLFSLKPLIWDHLRTYGLDSVFYVPNSTGTDMVSVVTEHALVTEEHVKYSITHAKTTLWDEYLRESDDIARRFVFAMLSDDLRTELEGHELHTMPAACLWMLVMGTVQSGSIERFVTMKEQFAKLSPVNEPGQNVELYNTKARCIAVELTRAGQWDWLLILPLIRALSSVSVEVFRAIFSPMLFQADTILTDCAHVPAHIKEQRLRAAHLHWADIFSLGAKRYRTLYDQKAWPPAQVPRDSGGAPEGMVAATNVSLSTMSVAQLTALVAETVAASLTTANTGHSGTQGHQGPAATGRQFPPSWRETGPPSGAATFKLKNENLFFWCSECRSGKGLWTKTHRKHGGSDKLTDADIKRMAKAVKDTGKLPSATTPSAMLCSPAPSAAEGINFEE